MGWPLDLDNPINDGLIGYWLFKEGSGKTALDLSGNGFTGAVGGNMSWVIGKHDSALNFPGGASDYITLPDLPASVGKDVTLISWIFSTSNTIRTIFAYGASGVQNGWWRFDYNASADPMKFTFDIKLDDGTNEQHESTILKSAVQGAWHQAGFTRRSDGFVDIFFDGISLGSTTLTAGLADDSSVIDIIGNKGGGAGALFLGQIDHVILYDRFFVPSEYAKLYWFPSWGFMNPDEIPVLDQYYTVEVGGAAGIMTTNTGFWGPTF
jgi:hypothetical protein